MKTILGRSAAKLIAEKVNKQQAIRSFIVCSKNGGQVDAFHQMVASLCGGGNEPRWMVPLQHGQDAASANVSRQMNRLLRYPSENQMSSFAVVQRRQRRCPKI